MVNFDGKGAGEATEGIASTGASWVPMDQFWTLASVALTRTW